MFRGLAVRPPFGKLRKQLDLLLKVNPSGILRLDSVSRLIINRQAESDALKNTIQQIVKLMGSKSRKLLSTLDNYEVIAARINLDMGPCKIRGVAVRR